MKFPSRSLIADMLKILVKHNWNKYFVKVLKTEE